MGVRRSGVRREAGGQFRLRRSGRRPRSFRRKSFPSRSSGGWCSIATPSTSSPKRSRPRSIPGHVVPGIDFTNDPLLQGRLFSYTDTQISRLGGAEFPRAADQPPALSDAKFATRRHASDGREPRAASLTSPTASIRPARARILSADFAPSPRRRARTKQGRSCASGPRASPITTVRRASSIAPCPRPNSGTFRTRSPSSSPRSKRLSSGAACSVISRRRGNLGDRSRRRSAWRGQARRDHAGTRACRTWSLRRRSSSVKRRTTLKGGSGRAGRRWRRWALIEAAPASPAGAGWSRRSEDRRRQGRRHRLPPTRAAVRARRPFSSTPWSSLRPQTARSRSPREAAAIDLVRDAFGHLKAIGVDAGGRSSSRPASAPKARKA